MVARTGLTASAGEPRRRVKRPHVKGIGRTGVAALLGIVGVFAVLAFTFVPVQPSAATPTREGTCNGCHPTGPDTLLVVSGLPAAYDPSVTYTITIWVDDLNGATGENSFSMDVAGGGIMNAAMQTDTNIEINTENTRASANDSVSPMSVSSWQVKWTAPASGQVTFTVNAVSSNDVDTGSDSPTDSDQIVVDARAIPEFPALVIPVFAVVAVILIAARSIKKR